MPHATFPTALGVCAIAWGDFGLTRFLLPDPERSGNDTETEPPSWVQEIISRVQRHLTGEVQDFADVRFDFRRVAPFNLSVLQATLKVKAGHTVTYGDIAATIGESAVASRAVGTALGANPWPLLIPCHRVVAATGKMTGFSGPGGISTKVRLLAIEGAQLVAE